MPGAEPHPSLDIRDALPERVRFAQRRRAFHDDVKARVHTFLEATGRGRHAPRSMVFSVLFWVLTPMAIYGAVVFGDLGRWPALALWCVGGFFLAGIGFNLGHDAIHSAISANPRVNRLLSLSFDVMGASSETWAGAHNFLHHTYTNIEGADSDIEPGPFLRLYPRPDDVYGFHRFQHFFAWPLYSLAALNWVWVKDYVQMLSPDPRTGRRMSTAGMAKVVAGKLSHITLFLLVPWALSPFLWWEILIAYIAAGMVAGFILAVVFQMAHVVEICEFPLPGEELRMDESWAEHQMRTTANFGGGNRLINFVVGGLDHQIEHHLFPRICHVHYPAIAPIVKQCAEDHGLPYLENKTFRGALASHTRVLKACGRKESAEAMRLAQLERQGQREAP